MEEVEAEEVFSSPDQPVRSMSLCPHYQIQLLRTIFPEDLSSFSSEVRQSCRATKLNIFIALFPNVTSHPF